MSSVPPDADDCTEFAPPKRRGGARAGAGRPKGSGRFGEATCPVRVPLRLLPTVQALLATPAVSFTAAVPGAMLPVVAAAPGTWPLYGVKIAAGFPSPADDYIEARLDLNQHLIRHKEATFFLRVQGESMRDAGIFDGDLLIVDRALTPADGKIVIAAVDGELTVKRLSLRQGRVRLCPENPAFPVLEIGDEQELLIWGVVTNVIHALG